MSPFKCQLFFWKREKQKQFSILALSFIRSKSCNCVNIKILFIHNSGKTTPIFYFFNTRYEKIVLGLLFTYVFTYIYISFKILQTSLIIKESSMKENSVGKSFTIEKILKIAFQNFHISWNTSKGISWTFIGSLKQGYTVKLFFQSISWNTVSGPFHETWNTLTLVFKFHYVSHQ